MRQRSQLSVFKLLKSVSMSLTSDYKLVKKHAYTETLTSIQCENQEQPMIRKKSMTRFYQFFGIDEHFSLKYKQ
jgi:hypothetical protein